MAGASSVATPRSRARVRIALSVIGLLAVMTLLLLWLMGAFTRKIAPGPAEPVLHRSADARTVEVTLRTVPVFESATGSVQPVHETTVGSRLLARVTATHAQAGASVKRGDVLIELDDEYLRSTLEQARAAAREAEAELAQAESDLGRAQRLAEQGLVTKEDSEKAQTRVKSATALLEQSRQAAVAGETALAYAIVRAPMDGMVIDKRVQAGDLVSPGQDLVTLYDPTHMQLVADVREQLGVRLAPGGQVGVHIESLGLECEGTIAEIVPRAATGSRSFAVKVVGPCPPDVRAGMFGRLSIPVGEREQILVPAGAIRSVGQLDMAMAVLPDGKVQRRFVQLGNQTAAGVEVLSGLEPGERVLAEGGE